MREAPREPAADAGRACRLGEHVEVRQGAGLRRVEIDDVELGGAVRDQLARPIGDGHGGAVGETS